MKPCAIRPSIWIMWRESRTVQLQPPQRGRSASGVEMASTGEVACFRNDGRTGAHAVAACYRIPDTAQECAHHHRQTGRQGRYARDGQKMQEMGFNILRPIVRTNSLLARLLTGLLYKLSELRSPNIREYLENQRIDTVINIPQHTSTSEKDRRLFYPSHRHRPQYSAHYQRPACQAHHRSN